MKDINDIREKAEKYQWACNVKGIKFSIDEFLSLDADRRRIKQEVEEKRAAQNAMNKVIPSLQGTEKAEKLEEMKGLSALVKEKGEELRVIEEKWEKLALLVPSIPLEMVPVGKDDSENVECKRWGEITEPGFQRKDHITLGKLLDIIDVERGVKLAGSRSYFLKGDGARLQHALLAYAMDFVHKRGYLLMDPPHIVSWEAMMGTSYFPGGEDQAYHLDTRDENFYLIGTAEVPVASYHKDEILTEDELPKRYAGYSPCYRREAGSYGKDTQGLYRVHQFYKVEQVIICKNDVEESMQLHEELLGNAESFIQSLNIPYRVVTVCTGDMGQGQVYKHDIECWMPSRNNYGETHSCSTFHDFQARRLNIRYKNQDGKNIFCHTLNNTLIASTRFLIPLLEQYQEADGSVVIPEALRPYMGGQERIVPKS